MYPLLGSFKRTIGNFAPPGKTIGMITRQEPNMVPIFANPTPETLIPTPTIKSTAVDFSTPVPSTGAGPYDHLAQLAILATLAKPAQVVVVNQDHKQIPTIVYDLDIDLYQRSDQLRHKYSGTAVIETYPGKYSYYWPPLGGSNCDQVGGVSECEYMANGYKVKDYVGIGWACDTGIPLGYIIEIVELGIWGECTDRGYTIKQDKDGLFWFDQLIGYPLAAWESPITVKTYAP